MENLNVEDLIKGMDLTRAYEWFTLLETDDATYEAVRYGIKLKFDINLYLQGWIIPRPKVQGVIINGRLFHSEDFFTELEARKKICKETLLEEYGNNNPVKERETPRIKGGK